VLATSAVGLHHAELFSQLTDDLAVIVHEPDALDAAQLDRLRAIGADVVEGKAVEVRSVDDVLTDVVVEGAGVVRADAVVVAPFAAARSAVLESLGVAAEDVEVFGRVVGRAVPADPTGRTSIDRVWAAGNVTDPMAQVVMAAAAGTRTGAMVNAMLVQEDLGRHLAAPA
ncbi:MAG: FAD-dependent oxidoreductase, partial [Dermatophilaceae bacterium]